MKFKVIQWNKNGDHPNDDVWRPFEDTGKLPTEPREGAVIRYFRHPTLSGKRQCKLCGDIMHNHGWMEANVATNSHHRAPMDVNGWDGSIDGIVCPGSLIIVYQNENI